MTDTHRAPSPPYGFDDDEATRRLLRSRPPAVCLAWAGSVLGATVVSAHALRGGRSSAVHMLKVVRCDGDVDHVVLRRYVRAEVLTDEPDIAACEGRVLRFAEHVNVPSPRLLGADPTGTESGTPALLMSRLPGRIVWDPPHQERWLRRLVEVLPHIHAAPLGDDDGLRAFAPYAQRSYEPPKWSHRPAVWARAVEVFFGPRPPDEVVFVHRDFHPGNVLWRRGTVSGVVDWQSACTGPPSADVGHCRANLLRHGIDVAERFTHLWERLTGRRYHPWADVATLVGCLDELRARPPRDPTGVETVLARAVAELGGNSR